MYGYEIFHESIMKNLINSVHTSNNSHAYIFEGNKGLGVFECARLFAAALTCADKDIAPCGACPSCVEAKGNNNPDIVYVRPSAGKKSIGAEQMRALEDDAAIKPFNSLHKVYIFEDGALLTEQAQNVFLKTFEEPPEYAVFIIVIENASLLLQTIRSRFVLINFPSVKDSTVRKYISEKYPEETDRLDFLVKYCAGIPKTADSVIKNEQFETLRQSALEKLFPLLARDNRSAFVILKYVDENKENFTDILNFWLSFLRDILLIQTGAYDSLINLDKTETLRDIASRVNPERITQMMDKVITAEKMAGRYVNSKSVALWLSLNYVN